MLRYVCALPNERTRGRFPQLYSESPEAIAAFARKWDVLGKAVYECPNPLLPNARRRCLETVAAIAVIFVDIDFKDLTEGPEAIGQRLRRLPLQPTWVRASGGGFHVGYELKEPIERSDAEYFQRAAALQKQLVACLSGDPMPSHSAALLRMPGTHNTKRGKPVLCETLWGSGEPVDLTDIEAMVDLLPETGIFARRSGNGYDKHSPLEAACTSAPVDVAQRLAAMCFKGRGGSAIHATQLSCTASLLRSGCTFDHTVDEVLQATQQAVANDPRTARWNWAQEEHEIRRMCADFISAKHPELFILLPDKLRVRWEEAQAEGRRPTIVFARHIGWHVRSFPVAADDAASAVVEEEREDESDGNLSRKFRFKLVPFGELKPGLEPLYLIDELIPIAGLVDVWGKAKCYKSFWTLDLMLHVAMGWEYRDRYVRQGAVVYCAFEGAHGYKKRVEALRRHYNIVE